MSFKDLQLKEEIIHTKLEFKFYKTQRQNRIIE
jgi:hypothetical protein